MKFHFIFVMDDYLIFISLVRFTFGRRECTLLCKLLIDNVVFGLVYSR